jgi:hypothetical protein
VRNSPLFVLLSFHEIEADNHHASQWILALLFAKVESVHMGRDEVDSNRFLERFSFSIISKIFRVLK